MKFIRNKGAALIETLVYVFILSLLSGAIVMSLLSLSHSYAAIQSSVAIESAASVALERMVRDLRNATSIDSANSTFNSSPGVLSLNSEDSSGNPLTLRFSVSSSQIRLSENNVDIGPLTSSKARVTRLVFIPVTTSRSESIKIEMTVESGQGDNYKTRAYYASAVLRSSYAD
jgi:Tfp pilus assembly protein PilW